mgnify:CR=1 FL=1
MNKPKNIVLIVCAAAIILFMNSCKCKEPAAASIQRNYTSEGFTKAIVIKYEVDGCVWMIQSENGEKFEPSNLPEEFRKDQLPVWLKYQFQKAGVSNCMAGKMVLISEIAKR